MINLPKTLQPVQHDLVSAECSSDDAELTCGRVVLAHDYLTQRGGAERVVLALTRMFPDAPILTSLYEPDSTFPEFSGRDIRTSLLQRYSVLRRDARRALPFLAYAWQRMDTPACDVVVASSSGWSHGLPVPPETIKVVYCHNPPRWLYQRTVYVRRRDERLALTLVAPALRRWDLRSASTADLYLANSTSVARRIEEAYGLAPAVLHPPVVMDTNGERHSVPDLEPGFWLTVSRGRSYKNVDVVVDAVERGRVGRLVVVGRPPVHSERPSAMVRWTGTVSDAQLRWLYANARGLVTVSHEDFGLTPLEANAFGTPALALRAGGHLDSVDEGVSGSWIEEANAESVRVAMLSFPNFDPEQVRLHAAKFSLEQFRRRLFSQVANLMSRR